VDKRAFAKIFPPIASFDEAAEQFDAERRIESETDVREVLKNLSESSLK
jgi:hypothetical protein